MARCLSCTKVVKIPSAHNMREWQLCYPCARKEHVEYYAERKDHGVGGTYLTPTRYEDMLTLKT